MIHRLAPAFALGTTLALSGAAFANPPPASQTTPAPSHSAKKSKAKHHSDNHQKPAAPSQKPAAPKK